MTPLQCFKNLIYGFLLCCSLNSFAANISVFHPFLKSLEPQQQQKSLKLHR